MLVAFIFAGANCTTAAVKDKKRAELHYSVGTSFLTSGNYPAALRELTAAVELDPKNPDIHNNLALAYLVRNKFIKAEEHVRRALQLKPGFTEARNNLGRILIEQGQHDLAITELKKCAEDLTYPFPEKSFSNLGLAYLYSSDYGRAEEHFRRSLDIRPKNCSTMNLYGRSLYEQKKYELAAAAFDKAISDCKENKLEETHYYSALTYFNLGQREKAEARFYEVMTLFPQSDYATKSKEMLKLIR